ncbi:alpha/beta hydrolase [Cryptosporangium arvum]|uniref:TAP-like protein n=1 Tax=Cryptosporangium arvum DSM 44712 TaxID=927661 RepID=A0A011AKT9_9ACTN|nr:alpha/beta hydrolase [Cryptosporangium arvum]EXG82581.1 TAP-like protein [Cryptosporangium arvum DSM 44712]
MKKTLLWSTPVVVAVALAAGTPALTPTRTVEVANASLSEAPAVRWGPCPKPPAGLAVDPRQRCATVRVPLDYTKPGGKTIPIAISRIPATGKAARRGVLVLNPGGPGGEGLNLPSTFTRTAGKPVLAAYDLIGFDPRGVGHSSPVTCGLQPAELVPPYPYPDRTGSIAANVAYATSAAQRCGARSGDLLPYVTTANTARDLDRIRAALGERTISYYGTSYGSYLGAAYATLFSSRTDRLVLDSAVDPSKVWYDQFRTQSRGQAIRFPDAAAYVAANAATLRFGRTLSAVTASYTELTARLDAAPAVVPGAPVPLSGAVLRGLTTALLSSDQYFPMLGEGWRAAADLAAGHATGKQLRTLQGLFGAMNVAAASSPGVPTDNAIASAYAVACGDARWPRDLREYARNVAADRKAYPLSAGAPANLWPCAFWPTQPVGKPVAVSGRGARNILILQNERDPATPLETGRGMHRALGHRSVLVTVNAGGHVVYGSNPHGPTACASRAADTFLATGTLPHKDTRCA